MAITSVPRSAELTAGVDAAAAKLLAGQPVMSSGALRLRDAVLGCAAFEALPMPVVAALVLRLDQASLWHALYALVALCGELQVRSKDIVVTVHGGTEGCVMIGVHAMQPDDRWYPRPSALPLAEIVPPGRPVHCDFLESDARFRESRAVIEALGGTLHGVGESDGIGITAVAWFPTISKTGCRTINAPLSGRRVLVVDDCRDLAESLCDYLRLLDAKAIPVTCGARAAWYLSRLPIDAVLIDLVMPHPHGYDLARWIRHRPALDHVRLVASTGLSSREDLCRSVACGFDAYLVKPPDLGCLALEMSASAPPAVVHRTSAVD